MLFLTILRAEETVSKTKYDFILDRYISLQSITNSLHKEIIVQSNAFEKKFELQAQSNFILSITDREKETKFKEVKSVVYTIILIASFSTGIIIGNKF